MEEILCYLFFLLITLVAVGLFLGSFAAERGRLETHLSDKKLLDVKVEKWRAMKRELCKWKDQERRKAEERKILRKKTMSDMVKQIISKD